jgi:hypothetical protein
MDKQSVEMNLNESGVMSKSIIAFKPEFTAAHNKALQKVNIDLDSLEQRLVTKNQINTQATSLKDFIKELGVIHQKMHIQFTNKSVMKTSQRINQLEILVLSQVDEERNRTE